MTFRFKKALLPIVVVSVLLSGAVYVAIAVGAGSSQAEYRVMVVSTAQVPGFPDAEFSDARAALKFASEKAEFAVVIPSHLPPGYAIAEIGIGQPPPTSTGSTLRRATLKFQSGERKFSLMETNAPFQFLGQDTAAVFKSLAPGAYVYKSSGEKATDYTVLTKSRGFVLTVPAGSALTEEELIRVLSTLPLD